MSDTPFHAVSDSYSSSIHVQSGDEKNGREVIKAHSGVASFDLIDAKTAQSSTKKWYCAKSKRAAVTMVYLSIFAVLGAMVRIVIAQLFGEECKNPGTVGWLKAGQPLCVTADGEASVEGGIIFADLPANLLGSFIMGFMLSSSALDLPTSLPVAWAPADSSFQSMDVIHLAIRTGFCGSLTTYSSWNSEMVVMIIDGEGSKLSLIFRAFLGYLIGLETALASFVLGKNVAKGIHSKINPEQHIEGLETKKLKERGVYVSSFLPDFERRFLPDMSMDEYQQYVDSNLVVPLFNWRESTKNNRQVGNPHLSLLIHIEITALVAGEKLSNEQISEGMKVGWDIDSLVKWMVNKKENEIGKQPIESKDFKFSTSILTFTTVMGILVIGIFFLNDIDAYTITYRTMLYAGLFAPFGALLRWKLSKLNGKIGGKYSWIPVGTLLANLIGSIISAFIIGLEYRMHEDEDFWVEGTLRAIKVGFAGSLSTVSTFISEFAGFLKSPHPINGYNYIWLSLGSSCIFGSIFYGAIVAGMDE